MTLTNKKIIKELNKTYTKILNLIIEDLKKSGIKEEDIKEILDNYHKEKNKK